MRSSQLGFAALAATLVMACAPGASQRWPSGSSSDVIGAAELQQHPEEDLYALIQRVRPAWLQARGPLSAQGANQVVVVIDGVRQDPGLAPLRGFRVSDVLELRRLSASDATTRFGTGMTAGAILIVTRHSG